MSGPGQRVWAEIDLSALRRNFARIVAHAGSAARVLAVVKADAYGHGAVPVARALVDAPGLWGFGVGDSAEALELRAAGIEAPLLILGTIIDQEEAAVVSHRVRVTVHSMDRIASLAAESERQGRRTAVHLMVDTGMGRLGALPERAADLARAVAASPHLLLEAVATHVSSSRPGHPFTRCQAERLSTLLATLRAEGIDPPLVHMANTAAILGGLGTEDFGAAAALVRPGIALYGVLGPDLSDKGTVFEPVLSLRTQIVYLKDVPAGTPIGYNGTHVTPRATRIATLPVGYNDGLSYRLSNRGRALVRGRSVPLVGAVSMDYTMLDVGQVPGVVVGDSVTLIGRDGKEQITVPELASVVGTIPYEICCALGKRVARLYERSTARPASTRRPAARPALSARPAQPAQSAPPVPPARPLTADGAA